MKLKPDKIQRLIAEIEGLVQVLQSMDLSYSEQIQNVHPSYKKSAKNLVHYRALRSVDITKLQKKLGDKGLSRIARAEPHVMASLQNTKDVLSKLISAEASSTQEGNVAHVSIKKSQKLIKTHTKNLLGYRSKGRRVRIMVTLPSEAAHNYEIVLNLLKAGMNTARINCAHDGPDDWKKMIEHLVKAKKQLKKNCRISMDLAGPKIRTGSIEPGPRVRKFRPKRNEFGKTINPANIVLVSQLNPYNNNELPVDQNWLKTLTEGDQIVFTDARNKDRELLVQKTENDQVVTSCQDTCYVETGAILTIAETDSSSEVKELPPIEQSLLLKKGDKLIITKKQIPGRPIQYDDQGVAQSDAIISCTSQEIFDHVRTGERILFDDGKIAGVIRAVGETEIEVEIVHAKANGSSLKADKGINLPETDLQISGLTKKDREDMKFVAQYADVVNFSFVNSPEDVNELLTEMESLGVINKLGIILKIETQKAYNNLTEILLAGMKNYPLGVMIARGDLAIESGWENIARIQQEILSLCDAAHIPDVWATQVLETLAKKGIPSRSEITDAASSLNAECVMLNKGPYILRAVKLLDHILSSMSGYQEKNVKMSPIMEKASISTSNKVYSN